MFYFIFWKFNQEDLKLGLNLWNSRFVEAMARVRNVSESIVTFGFLFLLYTVWLLRKWKKGKEMNCGFYLFFIGRWENFVVWEAKSNPMGCSSIGTSSFCLRSFVYFIFFCFWCVSLVLFSEEPNGVLVIEPKKKSLHDFVLFDLNRRRGRCLWSQLWRRINLVWIISQAIRFLRALCFREGSCLVLLGNFKWTWESWCFPILLSILR